MRAISYAYRANNSGKTPIDVVRDTGREDAVALLQEAHER